VEKLPIGRIVQNPKKGWEYHIITEPIGPIGLVVNDGAIASAKLLHRRPFMSIDMEVTSTMAIAIGRKGPKETIVSPSPLSSATIPIGIVAGADTRPCPPGHD